MKKLLKRLLKTLLIALPVFFLTTFTIYWFNLENRLIYYVIRPLLNKHYDSQERDRRL